MVSTAVQTHVALKRLHDFFCVETTPNGRFPQRANAAAAAPTEPLRIPEAPAGVAGAESTEPLRATDVSVDVAGIDVSAATFSWDAAPAGDAPRGGDGGTARGEDDDAAFAIRDVTLSVAPGELVCVVGPVACGKSTMVAGILGEARCRGGGVRLSGRVAYVPQQAWVQNASVRDNICFGLPFDAARYAEVIRACCLWPDIKALAAGDATIIGEKGVTLRYVIGLVVVVFVLCLCRR